MYRTPSTYHPDQHFRQQKTLRKNTLEGKLNFAIPRLLLLSIMFRLLIFFLRQQVPTQCWGLVVPALRLGAWAWGGGVRTSEGNQQ